MKTCPKCGGRMVQYELPPPNKFTEPTLSAFVHADTGEVHCGTPDRYGLHEDD